MKWEEESFKTNVLLKSIIGKELINDDNVAVMELVKNSYDSGATRVDIIFKNLLLNDDKNIKSIEDISNKTSQIIIQDDGSGMSKNDIKSKWLNIAYSSKIINNTQNNRYQAGNKGVGRFSCDRLGGFLNIYTRKENSAMIHLQISWKDFERIDEINTQIQDVPVYIREIELDSFKRITGFPLFTHGTILQIMKNNSIWTEIENTKINKNKLLKLKNSLERLINPNQSYDEHSFKLYLNVDEFKEDSSLSYIERITGQIKNQIFEKLDFKTTYIESLITEDGTKIITELKDKTTTVYRLIERNTEYPLLKDLKITLYYLNPYAKGYFKRQTGFRSVEFGSVFLFINGFRVNPYGDTNNDSFGLEVRKNQGRSRYFSNREILGRIEIKDFNNTFRVISSREGIVNDKPYKQLISDFEKKNNKYNGFFYKTIKRLEKFVVEGLDWDSTFENVDELNIEKEVLSEDWDESKEKFKLSNQSKLYKSSGALFQSLGISLRNVLDIYINEELIKNLIEEDIEKTNEKLARFLKTYNSLSANSFDDKTKKAISSLYRKVKKHEGISSDYSEEFERVLKEKRKVEEALTIVKKSHIEEYRLLKKKNLKDKKKAKEEKDRLKSELDKTKQENKKREEQVLFLQSIQPIEKTELIKLQHHIGLYAETIEDTILDFKMLLDEGDISKSEIIDYLKDISLEAQKILAINKYATKAKFLSKSQSIKVDIIQFIKEYIENIYRINATKDLKVKLNINDLIHVCKFEPLIITIIIDNLLNNSKKANARNVNINFLKNKFLVLEYIDDGEGLDSSIINPHEIFNMGVTTTDGSGLGLHHIQESLLKMRNSTIDVERIDRGIKFIIRLKI